MRTRLGQEHHLLGGNLVLLRGECRQPLLDLARRILCRHTVEDRYPEEAAVAEVFGTLPVVVAVILTLKASI